MQALSCQRLFVGRGTSGVGDRCAEDFHGRQRVYAVDGPVTRRTQDREVAGLGGPHGGEVSEGNEGDRKEYGGHKRKRKDDCSRYSFPG